MLLCSGFPGTFVGCMLTGSDGEEETWWWCQTLLTEQSCSAPYSLHCTRLEPSALLLCPLLMKSLCEGWGAGPCQPWALHPDKGRRLFSCALRKLIPKVALLCSRTCKTGHNSCCCKDQMLSQNRRHSWIQTKGIRTNQLYFLPTQFAALHNGFLFFPPLSISCLIFSQHNTSYFNYCYSCFYKTSETLGLCTRGLRTISSNCICSKEGRLSLSPWLSSSSV